MLVQGLNAVADYWWVWIIIAASSYWYGVRMMNRIGQPQLQRQGYFVWPVVPVLLFSILFIVSLLLVVLRYFIPQWFM